MTAVIVIIVLVVIVWMVFTQSQARQQVDVSSPLSPPEAAQVTRKYFGPIWTAVQGEGQFNYRPKLRKLPPTVSIDIKPAAHGSDVHIWTSAWSGKFGIMNHATLMWRKKRGLASRLAPGSVQKQPPGAGSEAA